MPYYIQSRGCKTAFVVLGSGSHRFIDFFPFGINKGLATQYLTKQLNVCEQTKIVGFGDSMNDKDLLTIGVKEGIFVKNIEHDCWGWFNANKQ